MTRTRQPNKTGAGAVSTGLVHALADIWAAVQARHPELPDAIIVVGSGTDAGASRARWGHFAALRWQLGDNQLPEVFVSGEGLRRCPTDILGTVLHEAAHALGHVRGIADTSRQGRYHNRRYATLAHEVGLAVTRHPSLGWSTTTLRAATAGAYAGPLDHLAEALVAYRHPEPTRRANRASNNPLPCRCHCGRRVRVAPRTLGAGAIICTLCDSPFVPTD